MRRCSGVRLFNDGRVIAAVYGVLALVASWQKYSHGHANNLRIFRASFWNVLAGRDLYALHPQQHADHFKYSPTFALLMAPFACLPELASAIAWNLCNVFALFAAIRFLNLSRDERALIVWLILLELIISIENFQSNALVAALMIATFVAFERGRPEAAGLFVALGASIKIFGGAAALLFLFYPAKGRFLFVTAAATFLLATLPVLVLSPAQLIGQYQSWFGLLQTDYFAEEKLSLMSWLHSWFGVEWPNSLVQSAGICLLLLPLLRRGINFDAAFRYRFLASLLVFVVIFNHKAESPMFILAVSGVAIWYAVSEHFLWRTAVVALVLLMTSLASTDLVPRHFRETVTTPLVLKAAPCILAWLLIEFELLRFNRATA